MTPIHKRCGTCSLCDMYLSTLPLFIYFTTSRTMLVTTLHNSCWTGVAWRSQIDDVQLPLILLPPSEVFMVWEKRGLVKETLQDPWWVWTSLLSWAPGWSWRTVKVRTKLRKRGVEVNPSSSGRSITKTNIYIGRLTRGKVGIIEVG